MVMLIDYIRCFIVARAKLENVQNIAFCPLEKHFIAGTVLSNEILQRCMQYLVLDKIVIAFNAKSLIKFVLLKYFNVHFCNKMRISDVLLNFFVSV